MAPSFPVESFPTTQPAFVMKPFTSGSVQSVEGFEPKMDLVMTAGHDWFRIDADKKHGRLSITAVVTDSENRSVRIIADGVLDLNAETMPMLLGDPNFTQNPFGHAVEQIRLECGHEAYKEIDCMIFVGSLRFIKEKTGLYAEIRAARVIPGTGSA